MKIISLIKNIGRSLVADRNEPHIEQKRDRFGHSYWRVRDYKTNKTYDFGCDREVIAWIEERYHSI